METKIVINGMHCDACKMLMEDILEDLQVEIKEFAVDLSKKQGRVTISSDKSFTQIKQSIEEEGEYLVEELSSLK